MGTANEILDGLNRLYSTFIMRDLKYILTGGIPLGFLVYGHPIPEPFKTAPGWSAVAFIACSYFLGIALMHAGMSLPNPRCPFIRMFNREPQGTKWYNKWYDKKSAFTEREVEAIRKLGEPQHTRYVERIVYIKEINGCAAVAGLSLLILLSMQGLGETSDSWIDWTKRLRPVLFLLLVVITSCWQNRSKAEVQDKLLNLKKKNDPK